MVVVVVLLVCDGLNVLRKSDSQIKRFDVIVLMMSASDLGDSEDGSDSRENA